MTSHAELVRRVEQRALGRCEFCRMYQALQGATFHLKHLLPSSRDGETNLDNLAWSCPGCNLHKANRIDALDPETRVLVPLFNPRRDCWDDHFSVRRL